MSLPCSQRVIRHCPTTSALLYPAFLISSHQIDQLLGRWGYGLVLAFALAQSGGVPVPGTTALAAASIYAGTGHRLAITGVIGAAAAGAICGYAISFALGRWGGWKLLERHGQRIGLTGDRLELGRYFFSAHGGKMVFLGRFVTGLRTWGGWLAGANLMAGRRFLGMNLAGGVAWASLNGLGYYYFGDVVTHASTGVNVALAVFAALSVIVTGTILRRRGSRFRLDAARAVRDTAD